MIHLILDCSLSREVNRNYKHRWCRLPTLDFEVYLSSTKYDGCLAVRLPCLMCSFHGVENSIQSCSKDLVRSELTRYISFWFPFLGTRNHVRIPFTEPFSFLIERFLAKKRSKCLLTERSPRFLAQAAST